MLSRKQEKKAQEKQGKKELELKTVKAKKKGKKRNCGKRHDIILHS